KLIHAILDNYAVHKHPKVRAWLGRHPRWTFHFTPTSCSWANAVESFFATLTRRRLQRGVFHSLVDLQAAINRYLGEHNRKPKPFVWTADPDHIIEKVNRHGTARDSNGDLDDPQCRCGGQRSAARARRPSWPFDGSRGADDPERSRGRRSRSAGAEPGRGDPPAFCAARRCRSGVAP